MKPRIVLAFLLTVSVALTGGWLLPGTASAEPSAISTSARAAALIDVASGRLLYSSRGNERMKIASLTKIMTAIVAIEHGNLSDTVVTSARAAGKEGSSIYLQRGEEMSLHHMLYGLMLRSGNDAATAIAEHVGGSEEGFVHLMNEKAKWLGLEQTHFMNPHGLDHQEHYSTADDMARLTAYALSNESFRDIVKTRIKTAPNPHAEWDYKWTNKNKMLSFYEGADGVKTGYTKQAFRCLVSSATRGGQQLAAVTLNDGDDWADHRRLLDWGFANYPLHDIVHSGEKLAGYKLAAAKGFRYPLAEGEASGLRSRLVLIRQQDIRYQLGDAGKLEYYLNDTYIGSVPVHQTQLDDSSGIERNETSDAAWLQASVTSESADGWFHAFRTVMRALLLGGKEAQRYG